MTVSAPQDTPFTVDSSHFAIIKKRFLHFNRKRLERTLSSLSHRQQLFLELVPLLFHTNHPAMPGYVRGENNCGVSQFKPSKELLKTARAVAKSFRYQSLQNKQPIIHAIFIMGSIGTIGQSRGSDLDFWICHDPELSEAALKQLQTRCDGIRQWGQSLGLEVCFFPMNADTFREGRNLALSDESSGNTQNKLLLDEFYRTGIHLAGRLPLWWYVPPEYEQHYREYSRELLEKRFLRATDVIDLGGLDNIPPQEFITAAVWQLYKAIEAPYKSLLKLQLLEVYVRRESDLDILSIKLKDAIYRNKLSVDNLDPYLLLFNSLTQYLEKHDQQQRIELIRRSFYFKVNKPLSRAPATSPASWQRRMLADLVHRWQWHKDKIKQLDNSRHWKAQRVIQEKRLLISELLNGYRLLSDYTQNIPSNTTPELHQEIALLGRKLYAAFERKGGKVERINTHITNDLSEDYLTFAQHQSQSGQWLWQVFPQKKHEPLQPKRALKSCSSLMELVTWCYANEILTDKTGSTIKYQSQDYNCQALYQALHKWYDPCSSEGALDFTRKPTPQSLLVAINLLADPDSPQLKSDYPSVNPLSAGRDKINLLKDIHLVSHNSWGEINVSSHDRSPLENYVRDLVKLFAPLRGSQAPARSGALFFCGQANHAQSLKLRLEQLTLQVQQALIHVPQDEHSLWILAEANELLCFEQKGAQLSCERLWSQEELLQKLAKPRDGYCAISIDPLSLHDAPLAAIFREPLNRAIQVFYCVEKSSGAAPADRARVFILDERNTLITYQAPFRNEQSLLQPLHRFIRSIITRLQLVNEDDHNFGVYPVEFYQLAEEEGGRFRAKRCHVTTELRNLQFFDLQAIADANSEEPESFSLYCGQRSFHPEDCGANIYRLVAGHILSQRRHAERYPCYLTDLDLGTNPEELVGNIPLQTAHFMMVKNRLEQYLNQALQQI